MISLIVTLIVVGLLLWLVSQLPIDATIQRIIHGVVIVCVIIWLIGMFWGPIGGIHFPR